jgi:hypothetical protein
MLSASSLRSAPPTVHTGHVAAVISPAKSAHAHGAPLAKIAAAAVAKPAVVVPQAGDANFDGQVNAADIPALLLALTDPSGYEKAYPNESDSQRSIADDVNQDGFVNNADLQQLLHNLIHQPPPPPPPPPPTIQVPITPTVQTSNTVALVVQANNISTSGPPVASTVVISGSAGNFVPLQSPEALLAGGGGDAQAAPATVTNNGPPMPTHARTNDIALIAFASDAGGGDQVIEGMLLNLADVEEPQMLAIEYGDEVVKHEVTVNKAVVPPPIEQLPGAEQAVAEQPAIVAAPEIVPEPVTPAVAHGSSFWGQSYWWLIATVATTAAAAATWWIYRRRLLGNVGTLLRRLGL